MKLSAIYRSVIKIILQDKITKNLTTLLKNSHTTFIQADPLNLPFVEKSINGCLLTNILNFSQDPPSNIERSTTCL